MKKNLLNPSPFRYMRPVLMRPTSPMGRLGVPMFWDPDPPQAPPQSGGDGGDGGDDQPGSSPGADALARLARLEAENKRLTGVAQKYNERLEADQEAERKRAEEQGEWEKLHRESKAEAEKTKAELEATAARVRAAEEYFSSAVEAGLGAIEDKTIREQWSTALQGLAPMERHRAFQAMSAAVAASTGAAGTEPQAGNTSRAPGGRPGSRKPQKTDRRMLASGGKDAEEARKAAVLESLGLK